MTDASLPARKRLAVPLLLLLALAPVCYTAIVIRAYGIDLPTWDEWNSALLFEKLARGTLTLGDLFAQQNEYRQFVPNLIFLAAARLTKWDVRYEMFFSLLLVCLVAYNVYRLGELTLRCGHTDRLSLFAAACLLLFSPVQFDNWLQGQQLIYFMPAVCLTTGLQIIYANKLRPWAKLLLCAALSTVATFSAANGVLLWALLPCAFVCTMPGSRSSYRRAWLVVWLGGFVLCAVLYFHGYQKPAAHPTLAFALLHPLAAIVYHLSLLGGAFSFGHLSLAILAGALMLTLYARALLRGIRSAHADREETRRMLCWLTLGAYALLTACLITVGRAGFGVVQSLSSRYTTYTLFLPLALLYLAQFALNKKRVRYARPAAVLCVLFLLHAPIYLLGIRRMSVMHVAQVHAKACVLLVNVMSDECQPHVYPDAARLRQFANTLDRLGYLRPPLLTSNRLRDIAAPAALPPTDYGTFTSLRRNGTDEYTATGYAMLPATGAPADAVLLAREGAEREPIVFAVAEMETNRDFVSALLRRGIYGDVRWRRAFSARDLPISTAAITAWAFDASTGKAYRLAGEFHFEH